MSWGAGAAPPSLESACLDEGVSFRDRPTPRRRTWPGVREDLETLPKGLGLNASSVWFLIFHPKFWEHSTCHEMVVVAELITLLRAGHGIKEWCAVPLRRPRPSYSSPIRVFVLSFAFLLSSSGACLRQEAVSSVVVRGRPPSSRTRCWERHLRPRLPKRRRPGLPCQTRTPSPAARRRLLFYSVPSCEPPKQSLLFCRFILLPRFFTEMFPLRTSATVWNIFHPPTPPPST